MNAHARFTQWGNSLAVRIPRGMAKQLHAFDGRPAGLEVKDGALVVTPLDVVPKYDLNALIEAITPENLHGEIDTGDAVGNEYP